MKKTHRTQTPARKRGTTKNRSPRESGPAEDIMPTDFLPSRALIVGSRQIARKGSGSGDAKRVTVTTASPVMVEVETSTDALPATAYGDCTLHLMILETPADDADGAPALLPVEEKPKRRPLMIVATYSNARVVEFFPTQSPPRDKADKNTPPPTQDLHAEQPGHRFWKVISQDKKIRACLDGKPDRNGNVPDLPTADELGELGELGERLFRALFVGDVRRLYDSARAAQQGRPLNIVLTCGVKWIAALPWEFAFDPMRRKYLASEEVHFTRGVMASVPAEVIARRSKVLRILVVSAQPTGLARLSIAEEQERICYAFSGLIAAGLVDIDVLTDASPEKLQKRLMREQHRRRKFDIVHFISHGEFKPDDAEGTLLLVNADGSQREFEVRPLREMLTSRGIHLVFLNACESGIDRQPGSRKRTDAKGAGDRESRRPARGLAQSLVEGGLPSVVANQYTVLDSAALVFAECFYQSLAYGSSIGQAAREARIALNHAIDGEAIDWAVPVLYARDPDTRLCLPSRDEPPSADPLPSPAAAAGARSDTSMRGTPDAPRDGRIRVGIADISKFFPHLHHTLVRLNKAQAVFEFVPSDVAIPLGVWKQGEPDPQTGRRTRYLIAERFARKLKHHPDRLGVDFLICATNHWMTWDGGDNNYGWWSSKPDCRVLLFSTGGLALPKTGAAAGRTVANAIVQSMAAQMAEETGADEPIHGTGSTMCPFYFNQKRVVKSISGVNRFCPKCRAYLREALPESFNDIKRAALIKAFDRLLTCFGKGA